MIIYFLQFKLSSLKITNGASIGLEENCVFQITRFAPLKTFEGVPSLAIFRVPTLFSISNSRTFPGLFQVKQVIFKVSSMLNSRTFPG